MCSEHSNTALIASRKVASDAKAYHQCRGILSELLDQLCGSVTAPEARKRKGGPGLRVSAPKRMANPFSTDLSPDLDQVELPAMFKNPSLSLHIDIGCAMGKCVHELSMRAERVAWNHLGLEIRPAIVQAAADRIRRGGGATQEFTNLRFMTCNFAHSGAALLDAIPGGLLRLVSIQFPDPWRRMKHRKRMLVQPAVVDLLSAKMETGAYVYISTDSRLAMRWMLQCFTAPGSQFQLLPADHDFSADATGGAFMYSAGAARVVEGRGNFGPAALANASEGGEDEEDDSKDEAEGAELDLMETAYAGYFIAYNPLVGIML